MTYRSHRGWNESDPLYEVATLLARAVIRNLRVRRCCHSKQTPLVQVPEKVLDHRLSSSLEPCSLDTRVKSTTLNPGEDECR